MDIDQQINREIGIHGQKWNSMHDGYFSDAIMATPLIEKIHHFFLRFLKGTFQ